MKYSNQFQLAAPDTVADNVRRVRHDKLPGAENAARTGTFRPDYRLFLMRYNIQIRNRMSKTKSEYDDRDLYSGLIRLHILHHAAEEQIFGLGMAEELARHGYRISPGTLYPLLHGLEKKGYLRSSARRNGKSLRKVYRATAQGRNALQKAKRKVRELFGELIEGKS
jgi:DNA-binding PadR family transcriptional regulator